jgi:hypothetical protein
MRLKNQTAEPIPSGKHGDQIWTSRENLLFPGLNSVLPKIILEIFDDARFGLAAFIRGIHAVDADKVREKRKNGR